MKATFRRGCGLLYFPETSVTTKQFEGDVDHWNEKGFGFLRCQGKRIFFSAHGVEPDWKGSRGWAFARGIPVKFNITERLVGGVSKHCATNVEPLFPMSEQEDLLSYRETSEILSLNRQKGFAFMIRPCGDALFLHKNDVVPAYETRWDLLEIGSPVYHGVQFDGYSSRWKAANAELYSFEELWRFKHEELPESAYEEPEPEPQPAPLVTAPELTQDSVLAPATRNKPMLQLILEKRKKT
jgi:cold shock CspA family protein